MFGLHKKPHRWQNDKIMFSITMKYYEKYKFVLRNLAILSLFCVLSNIFILKAKPWKIQLIYIYWCKHPQFVVSFLLVACKATITILSQAASAHNNNPFFPPFEFVSHLTNHRRGFEAWSWRGPLFRTAWQFVSLSARLSSGVTGSRIWSVWHEWNLYCAALLHKCLSFRHCFD